MGSLATYSCVSMPGKNQVKKIKMDDNGYRWIVLGGFDIYNQSGVYYPLTEVVKGLFAKGGIVRRRLDTGLCKGEYDHPKLDGLTHEQIIYRLAIIDPLFVSHHIRDMELIVKKDENGKDVVLVYGWVKPAGPYAGALEASLSNLEENVAFSVRSFCKIAQYNGRTAKLVNDIMTYDHVSEPGIKLANQFDTVCLEALSKNYNFTEQDFNNTIKIYDREGLENDIRTIRMIKDSQGWSKTEIIKLPSLNW